MKADLLLAPWIRRFLLEYILKERNLSINTQRSYRDTMILLLQFIAGDLKKQPGGLAILDLTENRLQAFLCISSRSGIALFAQGISGSVLSTRWHASSSGTARNTLFGQRRSEASQ